MPSMSEFASLMSQEDKSILTEIMEDVQSPDDSTDALTTTLVMQLPSATTTLRSSRIGDCSSLVTFTVRALARTLRFR